MQFDGFVRGRGCVREPNSDRFYRVQFPFLPCAATEDNNSRMDGAVGCIYVDTRFLPQSFAVPFRGFPRKAWCRVILTDWGDVELVPPLLPLVQMFWWYGSKAQIMRKVWPRLGYDSQHFIDPFTATASSVLGAALLPPVMTLNDIDAEVVNTLRAIRAGNARELAKLCVRPMWECDQHALEATMMNPGFDLRGSLDGHDDYFDMNLAAKFLVVQSGKFGDPSGKKGSWVLRQDERGVDVLVFEKGAKGVPRSTIDGEGLGMGQAVARAEVRVDSNTGVFRQVGIYRKHPEIQNGGKGTGAIRHGDEYEERVARLTLEIEAIAVRLRRARILCSEWSNCLPPAVLSRWHPTSIFLDPPYEGRLKIKYPHYRPGLAADVRKWCIENGGNENLRIALCGRQGNEVLRNYGWDCLPWIARSGYSNLAGHDAETEAKRQARMEMIWFSPHCIPAIYR